MLQVGIEWRKDRYKFLNPPLIDPSLDDINGAGTNVILDHNYITATAASAVEEAEQNSLVEGGGDRGIDNNEVITTSTMLSKSYNIVKRYEDSYNLVGSTTALVAVLQVKRRIGGGGA